MKTKRIAMMFNVRPEVKQDFKAAVTMNGADMYRVIENLMSGYVKKTQRKTQVNCKRRLE